MRYPVTERRLSSTSRAAFFTSSTVTARRRSGHVLICSMVSPVVSDAPYQRASELWLSCA